MSEAKRLTERLIDIWNKHDKQEWLAYTADNANYLAVGGFTGKGKDGAQRFFSIWQGAFPDTRVTARRIVTEGDVAILEGTFSGTHTGTLQAPSGPVPSTGKKVNTQFVNAISYSGGKVAASQLYFDQMELLAQLGLVQTPAAAAAR